MSVKLLRKLGTTLTRSAIHAGHEQLGDIYFAQTRR